jgi:hypothetical protein
MFQVFPAGNGVFLWVKEFLDEDLGWIAGFFYWYVSWTLCFVDFADETLRGSGMLGLVYLLRRC